MKRIRLPIFASLMVLSIAACQKRDPVDEEANAIAPAVANSSSGAVAGAPPAVANTASPSGPIPMAIQGRWGLTPADCEPGRSDSKGLLTITSTDIKFYESRGVPATSIESGSKGISGNFAMTGEGQSWTDYISLKLSGDGLIRTERNPPASYTYARCD